MLLLNSSLVHKGTISILKAKKGALNISSFAATAFSDFGLFNTLKEV